MKFNPSMIDYHKHGRILINMKNTHGNIGCKYIYENILKCIPEQFLIDMRLVNKYFCQIIDNMPIYHESLNFLVSKK